MKNWQAVLSWGSLSTLLITFWLLALFPAQLAMQISGQWLPVTAQSVQGSVWQGHLAKPGFPGFPEFNSISVHQLQWQLSPWSMMILEPEVAFSAEVSEVTVSGNAVLLSDDKLLMSGVQGQADLAQLSKLMRESFSLNLPYTAGLAGNLELDIKEAIISRTGCEKLQGQIEMHDMQIPLWPEPVGLQLELSCRDQAVIADIRDTGSLSLEARLTLSADGRYQFNGSLSPENKDQNNLLRMAGLQEQNGQFVFQFQ